MNSTRSTMDMSQRAYGRIEGHWVTAAGLIFPVGVKGVCGRGPKDMDDHEVWGIISSLCRLLSTLLTSVS